MSRSTFKSTPTIFTLCSVLARGNAYSHPRHKKEIWPLNAHAWKWLPAVYHARLLKTIPWSTPSPIPCLPLPHNPCLPHHLFVHSSHWSTPTPSTVVHTPWSTSTPHSVIPCSTLNLCSTTPHSLIHPTPAGPGAALGKIKHTSRFYSFLSHSHGALILLIQAYRESSPALCP